ncbi:hypothetical protein [Bacteroides sp.]|uniref:hypothetical protein n=1 Tax=Bacteroides sp. TaxID=29523 RepID=UPI0025C68B83|nr:hypothetical protein [Bacteroides sp.]
MKAKPIFNFILLSMLALAYTSCNDEIDNTLRFADTASIVDNTIDVYYPNSDPEGRAGAITIIGGDGDYSVYCDNPSVLEADKKFPNAFVLHPKGWGNATVIVIDGTKKSILLNVRVKQQEQKIVVNGLGVKIIEPDNQPLSDEVKEAIRLKALEFIPVKKVGGGYHLVWDDKTNYKEGTLIVYPEEYGKEEGQQTGTFSFNPFEQGDDLDTYQFKYTFKAEEVEHIFFMDEDRSPLSRTSVMTPIPWLEDISEHFQKDYPGIKVYTQQIW